jgi:hypothetical protein
VQDIYISVQEVYGASLPPLMHPRHPNAVAFSTGPFIVIWDWKADRKQARTLSTSCVVCKLGTHSSHVRTVQQFLLFEMSSSFLTSRLMPSLFCTVLFYSMCAAFAASPTSRDKHVLQSIGQQTGLS